jgi:hypothetical protein
MIKCAYCQDGIDIAIDPKNKDNLPIANDLIMCINCGEINVFTPFMSLRKITQEEYNSHKQEIIRFQRTRANTLKNIPNPQQNN